MDVQDSLGAFAGDIVIERPSMKVSIAITTMILVSLVLSLLAWIFWK